MERIETLVVGAGQAGLAASHHLRRLGREHLVLERARVAERWRSQRWDSLMFQFPDWSIELPGRRYESADPDAFSHKDAIAAYLDRYAIDMKVPVRTGVEVRRIERGSRDGVHRAMTPGGEIEARHVVIATGPYQRPVRPAVAGRLPARIAQVDAGAYRNPQELPSGAVLVVGTGASGCQIAEELHESGRRVFLAVGRHRRIPRRYRGHDVFWWRRELGHLDLTAEQVPPTRRMPPPLVTGVGGGHDVDLRAFSRRGIVLLGRIADVAGELLSIAPGLEQALAAGDSACDRFCADVDAYVERQGLDAPLSPVAAARMPVNAPAELDLAAAGISAVVWATGYARDFSWIGLPVVDAAGEPAQVRGVSAVPGIYFLGMPWLNKVKSTFLCGVGEDAAYIAEHIAAARRRRRGPRAAPPAPRSRAPR